MTTKPTAPLRPQSAKQLSVREFAAEWEKINGPAAGLPYSFAEAYARAAAPQSEKPTYAVGVSVLLVNPYGEVLLGERIAGAAYAVGMLSTPGGRIEEDEDMIDAAIRETQEETGLKLDAEDVKIIGFKEHFRFGSHYFMFYAEVRRWTGTLTNTEPNKCKSWEWLAVSEIPDNCTEPKDILATCAAAPTASLPPEPHLSPVEKSTLDTTTNEV